MMGILTEFWFYDVALLIVFTIGTFWFLFTRKKNLQREGIIYLYRTQVGVKAIDKIARKFKKILHPLSYVVILTGYVLMAGIIYLLSQSVFQYFKYGQEINALIGTKAPPVALFIPYFPKIFGYQNLFPDFWFIYFIIVIGVIAIVHEGAHGIYARLYGVKIKSTGFGFLGPILAFFVEQDEENMKKTKTLPQMTIISAGVFANIITGFILLGLLILFFHLAYMPNGVNVVDYSSAIVPISYLGNMVLTNETIQLNNVSLTKISIGDENYFVSQDFLDLSQEDLEKYKDVKLYLDMPAIRNNIHGTIVELNGNEINTVQELSEELSKLNVGDKTKIKVNFNDETKTYEIDLGSANVDGEEKAVIGVYIGNKPTLQVFSSIESLYKERGVNYDAKKFASVTNFFYYLFLWLIFANFVIALVNMIPVGIFDGGHMFYLTLFALTKSEKIAKKGLKISTIIILLSIAAMFGYWIFLIL